jgi:hypothetical protein
MSQKYNYLKKSASLLGIFSTILIASVFFGGIIYLSNFFIFHFNQVDNKHQQLASVTIFENILGVSIFFIVHSFFYFFIYFLVLKKYSLFINCFVSFFIMLIILKGFLNLQYIGNMKDFFLLKMLFIIAIGGFILPLLHRYVLKKIWFRK